MPSRPSPIPLSQRVGWAGRRRWSRWSTPCPKATRANLKFEFRSPHFISFVFRALADACSALFRNKEKQSKAFDFFVFFLFNARRCFAGYIHILFVWALSRQQYPFVLSKHKLLYRQHALLFLFLCCCHSKIVG